MKKIFLFIVIIMTISCSSDEEKSKIKEITVLSSKKVRIGDTIVLSGKDMDAISSVKFRNRFQYVFVVPFEKSNELIKVVVPHLNDENFNLLMIPNLSSHNSLDFNLIGTFRLPDISHPFPSGKDIGKPQMISENVIFIKCGNEIFKSINGGYNWVKLKQLDGVIGAMYFLNENVGWVVSTDVSTSTSGLYYTNDGGSTFNEIQNLSLTEVIVTDIYFSTENNGFLLCSNGKIFKTADNSNFELTYNYPDSEQVDKYLGFDEFSVYNDNLLVSHFNSNESGFIRKINSSYEYIPSSQIIIKNQLINESEAYFIKIDQGFGWKLYYTNNLGLNWEERNSRQIYNFHFFNKDKGISVSSDNSANHVIYETFDGGKNWTNKFEVGSVFHVKYITSYNKVELLTGNSDDEMWKHIYE